MKKTRYNVIAMASFALLLGMLACKPKNAGNAVSADAAAKT